MPCSSRNSLRWKPGGSFWRMVCSITRGPAKPIRAPGSAMLRSPSIANDAVTPPVVGSRSEEHTSELQSQFHLVCRLLLEKKKTKHTYTMQLKKKKEKL